MNQCNIYANVSSIETMGLVDGPGIRVVIFLQGCNLRCAYCHNPETWDCNTVKNKMSVEEVVSKVLRYKAYIEKNGGVTFSGGEPLLQSEFIYECSKRLKEEGIHVCVDTAGVASNYEKLIDLVDLFIVDIKSIYEEEYKYLTGQSIEKFYEFIKLLQEKNKKLWIRQVIVPSINDNEEHIVELANYINTLKNVEKVELLPYSTIGLDKYNKLNIKYRLSGIENLPQSKLNQLQSLLNEMIKIPIR